VAHVLTSIGKDFMDVTSEIHCPSCHTAASASANFCSQCGKKFKAPPLSTSLTKQLLVYFVSFFLAPFGLIYAFGYLRQSHTKGRIIGLAAILLTILGITAVILTAKTFMDSLYGSFDALIF